MTTETLGIIGLGNAGAALARPLSTRFALAGFDVEPTRREAVADLRLHWAGSAGELAERARTVLLSLPRPEASREVVEAIAGVRSPPELVIETSTITPKVARELAGTCRRAGIGFVDAAIAGGVQSMAAGEVTFLVGGEPGDLEAAGPVLEAIAERVHYLGPVGAGSGAKVVNNAVMHALMVVLVEAAAMARRLDVPMDKLIEILARPDGIMRPLEHRLGGRVVTGDYAGGMSVRNARKDSVLALETAGQLGVPLFATLAAHTPYEIAEREGYGELDYAALARLWESWCGVDFTER